MEMKSVILYITSLLICGTLCAQYDQPPSIFVMQSARDDVYIGGIFQTIGGVRASNVARCSGGPPRFEALGPGVPFSVNHMTLDSRERLYVAGDESGRARLARWDGQHWEPMALPDSMRGVLGMIIDPWGALCVMSSVRDTVIRPVLWRSVGAEWTCMDLPTQSAGRVLSAAVQGADVMFTQGNAVWHFDGHWLNQIDGPLPGSGQGLFGPERPRIFLRERRFWSIGPGGLREWSNRQWKEASPMPAMEGTFVQIEAMASTEDQLIVSRSYFYHEIDIGWMVRRLYRYGDGKWFQSNFPYHCNAMAIVGGYLLTGHTSDEYRPMISIRKLSDIPWVNIKRP